MMGLNNRFEMWVIYKSPKDFPGKVVARKHTPDGPLDHVKVQPLETLRALFKSQGYARFERFLNDDPCIVEVWL